MLLQQWIRHLLLFGRSLLLCCLVLLIIFYEMSFLWIYSFFPEKGSVMRGVPGMIVSISHSTNMQCLSIAGTTHGCPEIGNGSIVSLSQLTFQDNVHDSHVDLRGWFTLKASLCLPLLHFSVWVPPHSRRRVGDGDQTTAIFCWLHPLISVYIQPRKKVIYGYFPAGNHFTHLVQTTFVRLTSWAGKCWKRLGSGWLRARWMGSGLWRMEM